MSAQWRVGCVLVPGVVVLVSLAGSTPNAGPTGQMPWAIHFTLAPRWLALVPYFPDSAPYEDVRLKP